MFEKAKKAGVQPTDLADALGLHRVTVSYWYAGKTRPHGLIARRVDAALDTIARLLDAGLLPVPRGRGRGERTRAVLRAHILGPEETAEHSGLSSPPAVQ